MPQNFIFLGLIALMFPQAKIIHCRRNPVDTCVSIYTQKLHSLHRYAHDLRDLGFYYCQYRRLMTHWETVLPGRIFTLHYEEIIRDQEGMSRKLIDYIGLSWDKRCLHFYETERLVRTSSQLQVRQPVYTISRESWRNYEPWLNPLIDTLGDVINSY